MSIESELQERLNNHLLKFIGAEFGMIERRQKAQELLRAELVKELEDAVYWKVSGPSARLNEALVKLAIFEITVGCE